MCGLVGLINLNSNRNEISAAVEKMKQAIVHRGPDDEGTYLDPENQNLGLGHRRLAIIDPEHGMQPMSAADEQVTIVFNGVIYNFLELRRELIALGHPIHNYSDTATLLYAYLEWGEACVDKLRGMFGFVIWDRKKQKLFCARDRMGIKPFYFYRDESKFIFASEIKAILASGYVDSVANYAGLQDYITFQFCLGGKTFFQDIFKLEPGHTLCVQFDSDRIQCEIKQYWDLKYEIDDHHNESYFVDKLAFLLEDSIRQHLLSDVPLGAHLSGGLDSSTVVCMAKSMLEGVPLKTFTGAFHEGQQYNETHYAKLLAESVSADYQEIYIPSHEFSDILPKLIYFMDEPAAGPGLIPQYYVSKLASEHVKVVLGGQGGDELYIGYARYLVAYLEKCLHAAIFQEADNHKYAVSLETIVPNLPTLQTYKPMMQHFWAQDLFGNDDSRYFRLIDRSQGIKKLFQPGIFEQYSSYAAYQEIFNRADLHSLINHMTYFDLKASLPALLQVEDRTSMAVSLESRVPLLDHRLVEFMATIPPNIKFANGQTKYLFRETIKNVLPQEILNRQDKMGFPVPLNEWINKGGNSFVADILLSDTARQRGIYNIDAIEKSISQQGSFSRVIWGLLCLELWYQIYIDKKVFSG